MSTTGPERDPLLGRRLAGRYRIERVVARGGMATVYAAEDERLGREVAAKILAEPYASDDQFVERFLAEARTAASFSHPNLAHVYDSGSDGEIHFLVMELVDRSRSLRSELRERGSLAPLHAAGIGLDVLAGLQPIHERGLVHCDVKSGNILVGPEGTKLIDFGIARPAQRPSPGETSIGSLHAMSPEQLRGEPLSPASDLFAVGVVLFEALTGRVPFPGDTPAAVAAAHGRGLEAPPSQLVEGIAPRLDDVVLQALRRDPARRFASAAAMSVALTSAIEAQRALEERSVPDQTTQVVPVLRAAPPPPAERSPTAPARKAVGSVSTLAAVTALVAVPAIVLALGFFGSQPPQGGGADPSAAQPASTVAATPTLAPGTVRVPDTIGMTEAEAEAAARAAGLRWRIEWRVVAGQTPGIYDQEPPPGTIVEAGSRFVMYAYRSS